MQELGVLEALGWVLFLSHSHTEHCRSLALTLDSKSCVPCSHHRDFWMHVTLEKVLPGEEGPGRRAGHSRSASWPQCPQCFSPPGPHSSAAVQSGLRVPCWRCCRQKEQRCGTQCNLYPPTSHAGPILGPKQDLPTQPDFQELACLYRMKPLNTNRGQGKGASPPLSIGFKAPILSCCQSTRFLFMYFPPLGLASLCWPASTPNSSHAH